MTSKEELIKRHKDNLNEIAIDILKPLCEVYETPKRHDMFLKVKGVVVYQFQFREQFILFKEWLDNDK